MTKEELDFYKDKLESEKRRLVSETKEESKPEDFGSDVDTDEETDEAEEMGNRLGVAEVFRERVNEIDRALNRLAQGKYGLCENCGQEISKEVLNSVPESDLCENCKLAKK